jgi:hypothetical protein
MRYNLYCLGAFECAYQCRVGAAVGEDLSVALRRCSATSQGLHVQHLLSPGCAPNYLRVPVYLAGLSRYWWFTAVPNTMLAAMNHRVSITARRTANTVALPNHTTLLTALRSMSVTLPCSCSNVAEREADTPLY